MINAGDGTHEHPTQALLDAFTIRRHFRDDGDDSFVGRTIAIVGDLLHSRVVRSNVLLQRTLGSEVMLVAPPTLLPTGVEHWGCEVTSDSDSVLERADMVMMLRLKRERMPGGFFPTAGNTPNATAFTEAACPAA